MIYDTSKIFFNNIGEILIRFSGISLGHASLLALSNLTILFISSLEAK